MFIPYGGLRHVLLTLVAESSRDCGFRNEVNGMLIADSFLE